MSPTPQYIEDKLGVVAHSSSQPWEVKTGGLFQIQGQSGVYRETLSQKSEQLPRHIRLNCVTDTWSNRCFTTWPFPSLGSPLPLKRAEVSKRHRWKGLLEVNACGLTHSGTPGRGGSGWARSYILIRKIAQTTRTWGLTMDSMVKGTLDSQVSFKADDSQQPRELLPME